MEVTMTKKQTRDLQVFMTEQFGDRGDYRPVTIDMSDVTLISECDALLLNGGIETSFFAAGGTDVQKAECMRITCMVFLESKQQDVSISFFADPMKMASVLYNRPADRDAVDVMYQTLDEFKIMKFFLDIAHGNTRSPYTEAMMGSNK